MCITSVSAFSCKTVIAIAQYLCSYKHKGHSYRYILSSIYNGSIYSILLSLQARNDDIGIRLAALDQDGILVIVRLHAPRRRFQGRSSAP
jgi:uncharacterized membrane protein (UPF0136 family)